MRLHIMLYGLLLLTSNKSFSSKIIILNGSSSAGKTTLAHELQKLWDGALFLTGVDHFCDMILRERYEDGTNADEGWRFSVLTDKDNYPIVHISIGSLAQKVAHTMPQVIKCLADNGHDVIVDEVLFHEDALALHNYVEALQDHNVYFVGVMCSLQELERREKARGDRVIGLARGLVDIVHKYKKYYDIVVDTEMMDSATCAQKILNAIENIQKPEGFKRFRFDTIKCINK